jgi:hypothetical protein
MSVTSSNVSTPIGYREYSEFSATIDYREYQLERINVHVRTEVKKTGRNGRCLNQNLLLLFPFGAQPAPAPHAHFLISLTCPSSPAPS